MNTPFSSISLHLLIISSALAGAPAFAQTFNPTVSARGYNVFVKSTLTFQGSEVDAGVFTGADLVLAGNTTVGNHTSGYYPYAANDTRNVSLAITGKVIYQTATGSGESYLNNGYLRIGNLLLATDANRTTLFDHDTNGAVSNLLAAKGANYSSTPHIQVQRQQPAYTVTNADRAAQSPGIDTAAAFLKFTQSASIMNSYATPPAVCASQINTIVIPCESNPHVNLVSGKTNVINLTPAQLDNLNNYGTVIFNQSPSATAPLVINIALGGTAYTIPHFKMPSVGGLSTNSGNFMIWNFYQATSIGIDAGNELYGTIFAPNAAISRFGGNNINGQIISNTLDTGASGEIHDHVFSPSIPQCGGPLPVTLVGFSGKNSSNHATLSWTTAMELNFSHFEIESSTDGKSFFSTGSVSAKGTGSVYHFTDSKVLSTGLNYYRLKTIDVDGTSTFSGVIVISSDTTITNSEVYPSNPTAGELVSIAVHSATEVQIELRDSSGKLLDQMTGSASAITSLTAPTQPGLYLITITSSQGRETKRIIVQ